MFKHLIYDFDGTIADSYPLFVRFMHEIATDLDFKIECDDETLYRSLKITLRDAYAVSGFEKAYDYETIVRAFHQKQIQYKDDFFAFPQAKTLLLAAKEKGLHNYIYTHTGSIVKVMLANMGILELFDFILDASYGFPLKPEPDALLFLLRECKLDPKECLMIGDRPIDAYAGMRAGIAGCLWDANGLFPDSHPTFYIQDLFELNQIITT